MPSALTTDDFFADTATLTEALGLSTDLATIQDYVRMNEEAMDLSQIIQLQRRFEALHTKIEGFQELLDEAHDKITCIKRQLAQRAQRLSEAELQQEHRRFFTVEEDSLR